MKRWKKVSLIVLVLLVVLQVPGLYRRYQYGQMQKRLDDVNAEKHPADPNDPYTDYRGVIHVHSYLGGHSTGSPTTIIQAARDNQLDFVVMTEHGPPDSYAASAALQGHHQGILFLNGSEITASDGGRLLIFPAVSVGTFGARSTDAAVGRARDRGSLSFIAYPEGMPLDKVEGFDGIEIFNANTQTRLVNRVNVLFDVLWSYRTYAHLLMTHLYVRPERNLWQWDELNAKGRRLTAISGVDAHANIGLTMGTHASQSQGVLLDPYVLTFRIVRNYILLEKGRPLVMEDLVSALKDGRMYTGFDLMGDASGFRFTADNGEERVIMGQDLEARADIRLHVTVPRFGRIVLFRNGHRVEEASTVGNQEFTVHEKGVYRVEVYLDRLEKPLSEHPWIISNPIYVR